MSEQQDETRTEDAVGDLAARRWLFTFGSTEALIFAGELAFSRYITAFALPVLAGNIVGGSLIFAPVGHAQVRSDTG